MAIRGESAPQHRDPQGHLVHMRTAAPQRWEPQCHLVHKQRPRWLRTPEDQNHKNHLPHAAKNETTGLEETPNMGETLGGKGFDKLRPPTNAKNEWENQPNVNSLNWEDSPNPKN